MSTAPVCICIKWGVFASAMSRSTAPNRFTVRIAASDNNMAATEIKRIVISDTALFLTRSFQIILRVIKTPAFQIADGLHAKQQA